ncbi:MFS transporter [Paenibacillus thermoaerophilus]|uniref:MFS transporter n=1 Tax=Paenibacillus thermoaerophilus TaxID=1215385 RepID=A0ABW2UWT1_9BACL|nr:MFS transporter [Paenibacillus thermoaerophilus]TMV15898.1 MFS transporter [Paenibacillus thermoaerophilus]
MQSIRSGWWSGLVGWWQSASDAGVWGTYGSAESRGRNKGLSTQEMLLLTVNGLFTGGNALSGTFVNVYLWKTAQKLTTIGWFALFSHLSMALTFWIAGKWVKERNKMMALRAGVAVSAAFYLAVLGLGPMAADWILPLGVMQGLSAGLFWLAFNVVYFEVTGPATRDRFNGIAGLTGAFFGMTAPWLSGWLIARMGDGAGYRIVFGLSLAVFVAGVLCSLMLRKRERDDDEPYRWLSEFRRLRESGNPWRLVVPALAAQGVREGVFAFAIGLLVYIATSSELNLGQYSVLTSAVAFAAFAAAGRWMKPSRRSGGMLFAAVTLVAMIVPFFWGIDYAKLLWFGIVSAAVYPLYIVPMTSAAFDLIGRNEQSSRRKVELIVLREIALNVGRLAGTAVFLLVVAREPGPRAVNWMLLGVGSSPLLAWWFMRSWLKVSARLPGRRTANGER